MAANATTPEKVSTGISGLDDVLLGGLPRNGVYLLQGQPGVGKTTLALQFLLAGVQRGEKALYVALTESRREVEQVARAHGWSLDGLAVWEPPARWKDEGEQTLFHPADVELEETVRPIVDEVARVGPALVV